MVLPLPRQTAERYLPHASHSPRLARAGIRSPSLLFSTHSICVCLFQSWAPCSSIVPSRGATLVAVITTGSGLLYPSERETQKKERQARTACKKNARTTCPVYYLEEPSTARYLHGTILVRWSSYLSGAPLVPSHASSVHSRYLGTYAHPVKCGPD